jgi:hypothetical protein
MVACILAIVYSPFVDLPLTDTTAKHSPVQPAHALPGSSVTVAEAVLVWGVSVGREAVAPVATDVVAITCAYLC